MGRQLLGATLVLTAGLWLTGCATIRVSSHTDHGIIWSKYKTFDWGLPDALPAGDPRLEKDSFFRDHIEGAVEKAMATHGFALSATTERPDVVIHYHANVAERFDPDHVDRAYGYCARDDCPPRVSRYEAGTLVVDVVDASTNVLIWRGWAQGSLEGVLGNRDRLRRHIDDSVRQMFETLPSRR